MNILSAILVVLLAASVASAETNVTGFLDAGYTGTSAKAGTAGAEEMQVAGQSGWLINSGAVYLSRSSDKTSFFLDLPVARAGGSSLTIGTGSAQAYLTHTITDNLSMTLGQFDSIYGFEANDSKDRFFTFAGTTTNWATPGTQTGLMLRYTRDALSFDLVSANADGLDTFGASASQKGSPATGLRLGWGTEMLRASLGYLMTPDVDKDGKATNDTLINIQVGGTFGKLNVDLEMDQDTDASITEAGDIKKTATSMMILVTYMVNEKVNVGLRYDSLAANEGAAMATPAGASATDNQTETAIGVNYNCDENLGFRFAYHMMSSKATKAQTDAATGKVISLGGLYTF